MALFLVFFEVAGSTVAVKFPKSGYSSAESPYFDFELQFLVTTATQDEIQSQKWFCTGASMDETTETVASSFVPRKTVADSCTLQKLLLVVFFYHRAFISLPQLSHSTNTGLSRASFSCLGQGDTECPAMACINSMAHVSCFQSLLRSLYYLWLHTKKREDLVICEIT